MRRALHTREVVVRAYGGSWVTRDGQAAVLALGITGFPFGTAHRMLTGEPYKSLASCAPALPVIAERSRDT